MSEVIPRVFGVHDEKTLEQLNQVAACGAVTAAAIMADGHFGYSQPVGGVVGYDGQISVSGVGYDIACGNKAVRTNLTYGEIASSTSKFADQIASKINFGVGGRNSERGGSDHELFEDDHWSDVRPEVLALKELAREQLGTVGSGNHYVDVFVEMDQSFILTEEVLIERMCKDASCTIDRNVQHIHARNGDAFNPVIATRDRVGHLVHNWSDDSPVWVGVHFGSRGFGHKTATGFLNLAAGRGFDAGNVRGEGMMDKPVLFDVLSEIGQDYISAMELAGKYAYAGRDTVVQQVLDILGAESTHEVHNHHNFAWHEEHVVEGTNVELVVVRKGATPLFSGQESFIGGSMADVSVIVRGKGDEGDASEAEESLRSTVHGAGRIMSRTKAAGRWKKGRQVKRGEVSSEMFRQSIDKFGGLTVRGAGLDESVFVYRKLDDVLGHHTATTEVVHRLRPIIVVMAKPNEYDPYKD